MLAFTSSGYDDTVTLHAEHYEVPGYRLLFVQQPLCLFVCSLVHAFVHSRAFLDSYTPSLTHSFIPLFILSVIYSFIQSIIHSIVHSVCQDTLVLTLTNDLRVGMRTHVMHEPQSNIVCRTRRPASLKGKHMSLASWDDRKSIASGKWQVHMHGLGYIKALQASPDVCHAR
jgi:hypothetical protein